MIDGKLTGDGRETRNIQAVLTGGPSSEFFLEDADGRFLTVQATNEGTQLESSEPSEHDPNEESRLEADALQMELEALTKENQALKTEVGALEQKLSDENHIFGNCGALIASVWQNVMKRSQPKMWRFSGSSVSCVH